MKFRLIPPPPSFNDEETTLQAHLIHLVLQAFLIITGVSALSLFFIRPQFASQFQTGLVLLTTFLGLGGLLLLLTKGWLTLTRWLLLILFWLLSTWFVFFSGGLRSPAFFSCFIVVALAGWLFGPRMSFLMTGLCILTNISLVLLNQDHPGPSSEPALSTLLFSSSAYLIMLATLQTLLMNTIQRALKRAQNSEGQFRILFEQSPDGICITDTQNRIVMVNEALLQLLGYTQNELLGREPAPFIAPENLSTRPPRPYHVLRTSGIIYSERILAHKNGGRIPVIISGKELPDKRYQYILQDITLLKQAEKELEHKHKFAAQIMNAMGQGLTVTDLTGFEYVNPAFTEMTGYTLEEVKGKFPKDFTLAADHELLQTARTQRQAGKPSRYEIRLQAKSGEIIQVLVVAVPRWQDDQVIGSIAILTDLTEQKKMEQALRESKETTHEFLEKLKILHELSLELAKTDSLDDLYRKTIELGCTRLGFARISFILLENNTCTGTYTTDLEGHIQTEHYLQFNLEDAPEFNQLIQAKAWGHIRDALPLIANQPYENGWHMIVVLWDQHQPIGFLTLDSPPGHPQAQPYLNEFLHLLGITVSNLLIRKRVEAALKASEALYRQSIEAAGAVPYQLMHGSGTYEQPYAYMGEGIYALTGYTPQEMTPKIWDSLIVESKLRGEAAGLTMHAAIQMARAGKIRVWQCDYRLHTRHGETRWVADNAIEVLNEQGFSTGSMGILLDITERNMAQEALAREHFLLRTIIDHLPDYIYLKDTEQRCLVSNIANARTLGVTPEELVGKTLSDFYSPEEGEKYDAKDRKIIETGQGFINQENTFFDPETRTQHWTLMSRIPFQDAQGKVIGVIGISHDITAYKLAEIALAEQAEETAMLYQVSGELALAATSLETLAQRIADIVVFELNLAECSVWLIQEERRVLARLVYQGRKKPVVHVDVPINGPGLMVAAIQSGTVIYAPDVREDARYFPGAFQTLTELVVPLRIQDRVIGVFNIESPEVDAFSPRQQRIVTAFAERAALALENTRLVESLEKAISEVQTLNFILEQKVSERTAALEKRTIELETANKELEAFSYSVSHDLRAPLRAINGYSTILSEEYLELLPANAQQLLARIQNSAKRMSQLIDDLLAFSRITRKELNKRTIFPINLVHEVLHEHQSEQLNREIEFKLGELPPCEADPALLRQVYTNLIGNAIKFTRANANATIEIGATEEDDRVVYFVKDNGAGFDMRYVDKLFGVFQRLHTEEQFEGTGIGLANVKRIVMRHGGRIWAKAEVNNGAAFYFTLK